MLLPLSAAAQSFNEALLPSSKLSAFEAVRVEGDLRVELVPISGDQVPRIIYDLDDNDPKRFSFSVDDNGVLQIRHTAASRTIGIVKVRIYYREIVRLDVRSAEVKFLEPLVRDKAMFDLSIDGGARVSGEVVCGDIEARVAGESRLELSGECQFLTLTTTMKGKVELRDLKLFAGRITASLSSVVAVVADTRLEIDATTNAIVKYWGEPQILRSRSSVHGVVIHQE